LTGLNVQAETAPAMGIYISQTTDLIRLKLTKRQLNE